MATTKTKATKKKSTTKPAPKAPAKAVKGKRPKQLEVSGTERMQDPEIRACAEDLADAGDILSDAHKSREEAAVALIAMMKKKKLKSYVDEKLKLRVDLVSGSEKVKLKRLEEKGSSAA